VITAIYLWYQIHQWPACHTPNHTSILYESILSDDNEFSLLYETNCNNENSHYTSFNDSLSTMNSPLALSSPRQHGNNRNNKLNKISIFFQQRLKLSSHNMLLHCPHHYLVELMIGHI
jgi:hypothetical protein